MITKSHHFFLLRPRPWPLYSSFRGMNLFISILLIIKFNSSNPLFVSLLLISIGAFFWWLRYRGEFSLTGSESNSMERGLKSAILLFIRSEVLFFFSFFWSYFHFFLSPSLELGLTWPPVGVEMFSFINVPLINTLVLLSSGVTVTIRHFKRSVRNIRDFNLYLFLTVALGLIFTTLQILEYSRSFFSLRDRTFGTSFFVLTGFHGIHVLIGTVYLCTVLLRSIKISDLDTNCTRFELASWYWHFVDVVWIFLYFSIYYLND